MKKNIYKNIKNKINYFFMVLGYLVSVLRSVIFLFKRKYFSFLTFIFIFFFLEIPDLKAQGGTDPPVDTSLNPLTMNTFQELIETFLRQFVIPLGTIVATLAVVYSGFLFVTAQGSPDKISQAKSALFWALIGGVILLGSWAIAEMIQATIDPIT